MVKKKKASEPCCDGYKVRQRRGITTTKHDVDCPVFQQELLSMGGKMAKQAKAAKEGKSMPKSKRGTGKSNGKVDKKVGDVLVQKFLKLDKPEQEDVLLWAEWDFGQWADSFISGINEGDYDDYIGRIIRAAVDRVRPISNPQNEEQAVSKVAVYDVLKYAGRISKDLGLGILITRDNAAEIVEKHAAEHRAFLKAKHDEEIKAAQQKTREAAKEKKKAESKKTAKKKTVKKKTSKKTVSKKTSSKKTSSKKKVAAAPTRKVAKVNARSKKGVAKAGKRKVVAKK